MVNVVKVGYKRYDYEVIPTDTTTLGVVYGPAWLPGFRASIDYYDIVINGAMSTLTDQDIVNRGDRPHYLRGVYHDGAFKPVGRQESHALYALSQANALCRLEPDQTLSEGTIVDVIPV